MNVRAAVRPISPRYRRWRRFLRELPVDPDQLAAPVAEPGPNDFIMCGCSRTGTTMLAATLFQPPRVVSVMEPWEGMRKPPQELFASMRDETITTGKLSHGRLDVPTLLDNGRVKWIGDGEKPVELSLNPDFLLGIKWPIFWRYLELLRTTKFLVTVRHPAEVLESFTARPGTLSLGLDYDTRFNKIMNSDLKSMTNDPARRRALFYEYVNSRLIPHLDRPNVFTVRYERWFTEPDTLLAELSVFLDRDVTKSSVTIRPPVSGGAASSRDTALIRELCPSASTLGYQV